MKVNELMVGDWVMFPNFIEKVQEVAYVEGKGYCASFAASATLFPIPIDKLKPIPLTDEILEKNGFKNIKERIDGECDSFSNLFELNEDVVLGKHDDLYEVCHEKWNGDWDVYDHHPVFAIRHLHQLQNVLSLMGFVKEIGL